MSRRVVCIICIELECTKLNKDTLLKSYQNYEHLNVLKLEILDAKFSDFCCEFVGCQGTRVAVNLLVGCILAKKVRFEDVTPFAPPLYSCEKIYQNIRTEDSIFTLRCHE